MADAGDGLDLAAYLARIAYDGPLAPRAGVLAGLQQAHQRAIPFENLSIPLGESVRLDLPWLMDKLVRRRRGGYCFEQNSLFRAVLDRIGFRTSILAARVRSTDAAPTSRNHMTLRVGDADGGDWLVDVGFGSTSPGRPLPIVDGAAIQGTAFRHCLAQRRPGQWRLSAWAVGMAEPAAWYEFTEEPHFPIDMAMANYWTATHPESRFTQVLTAQRIDAEGALVLRDWTLTRYTARGQQEERLAGEPARLALIREELGIDIPADAELRMPFAPA